MLLEPEVGKETKCKKLQQYWQSFIYELQTIFYKIIQNIYQENL